MPRVQRAAGELPEGWAIQLYIERGYKPSVEQIDHLLGLLAAPKDDTEQQDSTHV